MDEAEIDEEPEPEQVQAQPRGAARGDRDLPQEELDVMDPHYGPVPWLASGGAAC
jgi:hypothetical protein